MLEADYISLLRVLARHQVDFIVVGGMSAVIHGAPITTRDLDVVYRRDPANIQRALAALNQLQARFRINPDIAPNASHLESLGHKLLTTAFGRLDMLGSIGKQLTYEDLIAEVEPLQFNGFTLNVLRLEKLIALKEELARETDLAMLPLLRRTLIEKRRLTESSRPASSPSDARKPPRPDCA